MSSRTERDALTVPLPLLELDRLRGDWQRWRGDRKLPHHSAINPIELTYCLPHLAVVDIERDPFRPRYRLVGTRLARSWGRELRGAYIDRVYHWPLRKEIVAAYRRVVDTAEPVFSDRLFNLGLRRIGYFRLLLPFAAEQEDRVDQVLVAIYPSNRQVAAGNEARATSDWRSFLVRGRLHG